MQDDGASIIIIGTELTEGIIQDSHAKFLTEHLVHLHYHVNEIVTIADDNSIGLILSKLARHNKLVIITGGLGPTSDDMTRSFIAKVAGVELEKNEESFSRLYARLKDRAYGANEKQAYFPSGFTPLVNPRGTADGFLGYAGSTLLVSLPGPPREAHPLFEEEVIPYLMKIQNIKAEKREEYSTFLIPEARLEEACEEVSTSLTWGTRFQDYKISLFLSGGTENERKDAIERLRALVGRELVKDGNVSSFTLLEDLLIQNGKTIATAESCTGGLLGSIFTERPGSSSYYKGGIISYDPEVKRDVLGVRQETIDKFGVVSRECAKEMAEGALFECDTDFAVSITGVAGPDKSEGKEVGTVCFGFASKEKEPYTVKLKFMGISRQAVRARACVAAALLMYEYINNKLVDIASRWDYI